MQYDHEVQGTSVVKPLQGKGRVNGDATVVRPLLNSSRGIVLTQALYPQYGDHDPYYMAAAAIDTAVRNAVAAGANPKHIALLDNFCWCLAKDPFRLAQLKRAAKACYDYAVAYGTPFISGKDSMFNDFSGFDAHGKPVTLSIPPTLLVSAIGIIDDITDAVSLDFKVPGDLIYVLGGQREEAVVDAKQNMRVYAAVATAIKNRLIASSQSVGRGGIAVALAKSSIAGQLGITVSVDKEELFSESQGRIVVSVDPKCKKELEAIMKDITHKEIGTVTDEQMFQVNNSRGKSLVHASVDTLTKAYRSYFAGW